MAVEIIRRAESIEEARRLAHAMGTLELVVSMAAQGVWEEAEPYGTETALDGERVDIDLGGVRDDAAFVVLHGVGRRMRPSASMRPAGWIVVVGRGR